MINRIRTLREKTVKMFILYSEYKIVPTREELKLKKTQNIINMHKKQDDYAFPLDFYEKIGSDYIKLDINNTDYSVLRKMIQEQKLVLYYEDTQFIDTLVDYEHQKLLFNDTENYSKVLFDIIRRNGGTIKGLTDYEKITDNDKKHLRDSSRMVRQDGNKIYKELALSSDNILTQKIPQSTGPDFLASINKYCQLNDVNTHIIWCTLRRAITKSESTLYEKELESINTNRKAINNTLLYSTGLLESLKEISEICGFKIDQARGIITGGASYSCFTGNHQKLYNLAKAVGEQLYNATKKPMELKPIKTSRMPNDTSTFKNLKYMFSRFGLTLILDPASASRKRSVPGTKERYFDKEFEMCVYSQYVRLAFSGLAFDTGLPIDDAFTHLKNNYKKI